jgi:hypothetical protein
VTFTVILGFLFPKLLWIQFIGRVLCLVCSRPWVWKSAKLLWSWRYRVGIGQNKALKSSQFLPGFNYFSWIVTSQFALSLYNFQSSEKLHSDSVYQCLIGFMEMFFWGHYFAIFTDVIPGTETGFEFVRFLSRVSRRVTSPNNKWLAREKEVYWCKERQSACLGGTQKNCFWEFWFSFWHILGHALQGPRNCFLIGGPLGGWALFPSLFWAHIRILRTVCAVSVSCWL